VPSTTLPGVTLADVEAFTPSNVWAIGDGTAEHWNGRRWSIDQHSLFGDVRAMAGTPVPALLSTAVPAGLHRRGTTIGSTPSPRDPGDSARRGETAREAKGHVFDR
jgi:hypothetical protein